jgi:chorismate-pyruvate lyase
MSQCTASTVASPAATGPGQLLFPLAEFYARENTPLPRIDVVPGEAVPEPQRQLLVHARDMTPTLEAFHRSDIHIEVWGRAQHGEAYFREVVLRLDRDQRPVEFGANKIHLARFGPEERRLILDEYLPLGHILNTHRVPHRGQPLAYLRIESDALMNRAFRRAGQHVLYGRRNTITDLQGRALSEIVEILPPH